MKVYRYIHIHVTCKSSKSLYQTLQFSNSPSKMSKFPPWGNSPQVGHHCLSEINEGHDSSRYCFIAFSPINCTAKPISTASFPGLRPPCVSDSFSLSAVERSNISCSSHTTVDQEILIRLGKAANVFGRLNNRVWKNRHLSIRTKVRVYEACVLSMVRRLGQHINISRIKVWCFSHQKPKVHSW